MNLRLSSVLAGTIEYRDFTGTELRHPSWRGLLTDVLAEQAALPGELSHPFRVNTVAPAKAEPRVYFH